MTRRKLLWTALLIVATCAAVAVGVFARPYVIAKYWGKWADLGGAMLFKAPLAEAQLIGANLRNADLRDANLRDARLWEADLKGADLRGADLRNAGLEGADLTGTDLRGADVQDALYDEYTVWPAGFDPDAAGAVQMVLFDSGLYT